MAFKNCLNCILNGRGGTMKTAKKQNEKKNDDWKRRKIDRNKNREVCEKRVGDLREKSITKHINKKGL